MRDRSREPRTQNARALPVAALFLVLCLGPFFAHAQGYNKDAGREQERKTPRAEDRERAAAEQRRKEAAERENARERERERRAEQRRDREHSEQREFTRRKNEMHQADRERESARRQRDAERSRESESRRRNVQPSTPAPRPAAGPYSLPATGNPPRPVTVSGVTCSANPVCPSTTGYGNVCRSVQNSYSGTGAMKEGRRDIVSRCRAANAPDACSPDFRLTYGGGCAHQCASVVSCTSTASR